MNNCFTITMNNLDKNNRFEASEGIDVLNVKSVGHEKHYFVALGGRRQLRESRQIQVGLGVKDLDNLIHKVGGKNKILDSVFVSWGGTRNLPFLTYRHTFSENVLIKFNFLANRLENKNIPFSIKSSTNTGRIVIGVGTKDTEDRQKPIVSSLLSLKNGTYCVLSDGTKNTVVSFINNKISSYLAKNVPQNLYTLYVNKYYEPERINTFPMKKGVIVNE